MEKDNFFTQARIEPNYFFQNRCVYYNKREFATKQRKSDNVQCTIEFPQYRKELVSLALALISATIYY